MSATLSTLLRPLPTKNPLFLVGTSAVATVALIALGTIVLKSSQPKKITRGPSKKVLFELSKAEQDELPYPPDVFPGARDVQSPYGSVRVYEWGPEDGKKVLLIHGITTPCIALGSVANALVQRGCRVLLFDLFGRGYSDTPDLPHDTRLYTTQILLALTSSPLAWTPDGFSVVGYSLGGGIAAEFVVTFPHLVKDVALLAPAGLIRSYHFGWASRLLYTPFVPESLVNYLVGRRLRGTSAQRTSAVRVEREGAGSQTDKVVNAEIKGNRDPAFESAPLSVSRPNVTVAEAVQWQIEEHEGFVSSFVSSVRYAPIENQQATWELIKQREGKVLVVAGKTDVVILSKELKEDVLSLAGEEKIVWREVDGGHEFPITKGDEVVKLIAESWGL